MPCNRLRSCSAFLFLVSHMFYSCCHVGPIAALRAVCELSHFLEPCRFMMIVDQTTVAVKPMTIIGRVELSPAWKINAFANK